MNPRRLTWQYAAAAAWVIFTVALAVWWLIFGLSQARHLSALEGPEAAQVSRVTRMLVLEGAVLVLMLFGGGFAMLRAIRREQRRSREQREFFMAFTHDLKTTLTSLRLQAEALREDLPDAAHNPNLHRLLKDAVRLQLQLENALALTTTGGAVFIEAIEVRPLVAYLREDFPDLVIDISGEARVRADRRAIESVLRNLLQNAMVHGRARRVSLDLRRSATGAIEIIVTDDGSGAAVDLSTVLDRPFVRPTPTSGSGVGLYVCGRLLQQMHGQLHILRRPAPGFAVSIVLPEAA